MEEEDYDYDGEKPAQSNDAPVTPGAQGRAPEPTSPEPEPEEPEDTPEEARMKKEKKKQTNKFSSMLRSLRVRANTIFFHVTHFNLFGY